MAVTKLTNLVNPQVVADSISAELPKAIKFSGVAVIDTTLEGQPGNTITVPKYAYIGDATDVAEGNAIETTTLTATSGQATIKKVGKAVELTDEAILSAVGDPVGEATGQLTKSIASKIDQDTLDCLKTTSKSVGAAATAFSIKLISDALDTFEDEELGEKKFLYVNPVHMGTIRTSSEFTHASALGDNTLITGAVGMIYGCEVIPSRRIVDEGSQYTCVLAKEKSVSVYLKRDVMVETDRNILTKTTTISADEHYVAYLKDESRVCKIVCKSAGAA